MEHLFYKELRRPESLEDLIQLITRLEGSNRLTSGKDFLRWLMIERAYRLNQGMKYIHKWGIWLTLLKNIEKCSLPKVSLLWLDCSKEVRLYYENPKKRGIYLCT